MIEAVTLFLTHSCNNRCLVKTSNSELRCRMPKYCQMTSDNTRQMFMEIKLSISQQCWETLHHLGLASAIYDDNGNENIFKSSLDFLHPTRWVPPVVPGEAVISPFESETFCCQLQQDCQRLTEAGGCCKYCCKYLNKVDKQNYLSMSMDQQNKGSYTSNTYIHNTKITSSDIQQEEEKKKHRDFNHPQGCCIALTEMLHVMFCYPEVYTDLKFISICTMPLELLYQKRSIKIHKQMKMVFILILLLIKFVLTKTIFNNGDNIQPMKNIY
jgi:hypothetical protein